MNKEKVYFMGILANTDSSILKIKLDHGFEIESVPSKEIINFISTIEKLPLLNIGRKLHLDCSCVDKSTDQVYVIKNSFDNDNLYDEKTEVTNSEIFNLAGRLKRYLDYKIQLMRLFKEGSISLPYKYFYVVVNEIPHRIMWWGDPSYSLMNLEQKYTLEDSEILNLREFIQNTKFPFEKDFLRLAFDIFDLSHKTNNSALSFLSLMISLETLFHSGERNIRGKISESVATLLGENEKRSKEISSEIKELYKKRCDIVHEGKIKIVKKEDLLNLRNYVRESIKEIYKINKNKDELLDLLHK